MYENKEILIPLEQTKVTMEKSVRKYLTSILEMEAYNYATFIEDCESPIEQIMGLALWRHLELQGRHIDYEMINIQTQYPYIVDENTEKYRLDFLITLDDPNKKEYKFVVECDSEKHHFTEERFYKDRERDRDLLEAGYVTIRFTGKEIVKDPSACARSVYHTIWQFVNR